MTQLPRTIRWRETAGEFFERGRRRPIIIAATPHALIFRVKGDPTQYPLTHEAALAYAMQLQARTRQLSKEIEAAGGAPLAPPPKMRRHVVRAPRPEVRP